MAESTISYNHILSLSLQESQMDRYFDLKQNYYNFLFGCSWQFTQSEVRVTFR